MRESPKTAKPSDVVLVICPPIDTRDWVSRRQHAGILRYARTLDWEVRISSLSVPVDMSEVKRLVREVRPIGIVSRLPVTLPKSVTGGLPVVYFDCEVNQEKACVIRHDAVATTHLAVAELFSRPCRNFAFVAFPGPYIWCKARERAFRNEVSRRRGRFCGVFTPSVLREPVIRRELKPWLAGLPRPCAIFAANDIMAENVIRVCVRMGLRVPEEFAVVGVDDDPKRCNRSDPSITSVIPDWEAGAFLAMETLSGAIRGRPRPAGGVFRPLGIARRGSTDSRSVPSRMFVTKAVEYIREHAGEGISSADVVATMGCSRRLAELRFREVTGTSILEEIFRVRMEIARAMLLRENCYLETVAHSCGWKTVARFCNDFRRATGLTPTAWRRRG